jgi:hypothetical protein
VSGPTSNGEPDDAGSGPKQRAADQLKQFAAAAEKVRSRADLAAKAVGGLGLTAVAALGITEFADVFPAEGKWWWVVGLLGGFVAMATAVLITAKRLWNVNKPLVHTSSVRTMHDLSGQEDTEVQRVYQNMARENGAPSLQAYEARAHRWERIAARLPEQDPRRARLNERAATVLAKVMATQTRAAAIVIRKRATDAVASADALLPALFFVGGLVAAGVSADALDSARNATARVRSCAEAADVLLKQGKIPLARLSPDCGFDAETMTASSPAPTAAPPDVRVEDATSLSNLTAQYQACVAANRSVEACEAVRKRIVPG